MNIENKKLTPDETLNKVIECLLCSKCTNYLFPPLSFDENTSELVCGRCVKHQSDGKKSNDDQCDDDQSESNDIIKNKVLEPINKICALLLFPCYFTQFGCREKCSWEDAKRHELMCPFRQYKCPVEQGCEWTGSASNLKKHCIHSHPTLSEDNSMNLDFILNAISEDKCENFLVDAVGELFVFQTKYDFRKEMFFCDVRFIGPPQRAPRFQFKIEFSYKERKYIERKQVDDDSTFDINVDTAIGIKTQLIKAMLNNETGVFLKVEIAMRIPLYNGEPDETLMHEIECPVCKDHMIRPIRMCKSGHSICNACYQKLDTCPTCREQFADVRNLALESLSEHMHYRCMYYNEGCEYRDIPQNIENHEATCEIKAVCQLKRTMATKAEVRIIAVTGQPNVPHNKRPTILIYPTVSPESVVIPIISCILGFPLLALMIICCLRRRAKLARERERRRNCDVEHGGRSSRAISLRSDRAMSRGFPSLELDTVVEERSDPEPEATVIEMITPDKESIS